MIELKHITKTFTVKSGDVEALKDINLTIEDGDIYGIIGLSGAGKSTLVRCINMLERPTSGQVVVNGLNMEQLSAKELRDARRGITMVFQQFNLLMQRNCLRNVCFPMEIAGVKKADAVKRARELLELVGLPDKANAFPAQLSGGQQQRVAIARALATNPKVLLCDEATSALDPNTTHSILSLIKEINEKLGITVVVITHQMSVVEEICKHVAILDHGEVAEKGLVTEIFSNPQTAAAKRLVYQEDPDDSRSFGPDDHIIRVAFTGTTSSERPLVAATAVDTGVLLSVIYADTSILDGQVCGSMLLGLPADQAQRNKVLTYLRGIEGITVEEVVSE
ncbi:MAG: ATP-binding cassette domain-containing protein [Oscillospiraceae bacterium]|nr:ATP-binding cassette domain-containing protein [Oscillospiraceae bacterium]